GLLRGLLRVLLRLLERGVQVVDRRLVLLRRRVRAVGEPAAAAVADALRVAGLLPALEAAVVVLHGPRVRALRQTDLVPARVAGLLARHDTGRAGLRGDLVGVHLAHRRGPPPLPAPVPPPPPRRPPRAPAAPPA